MFFFHHFCYIVYPAIMKSIVNTKVAGLGALMMFAVGKSMENCGEFTPKIVKFMLCFDFVIN